MDSRPPSSSVESTLPTSLRNVCSILHYLSVCITAVSAGRERLGESFLWKTKVLAVRSKSDTYSLVKTFSSRKVKCVSNLSIRSSFPLRIMQVFKKTFNFRRLKMWAQFPCIRSPWSWMMGIVAIPALSLGDCSVQCSSVDVSAVDREVISQNNLHTVKYFFLIFVKNS